MSHLTIVAKLVAEAGHEAEVERELQGLVAPTRAEEGCVQYDLHRSNEDPRVFLFYENWESDESWQAHMKSAHIAAMGQALEGKLAEREIFQMTRIA